MAHSHTMNFDPAHYELSKLGDKPGNFGKKMFGLGVVASGAGLALGLTGGHLDHFLMSWLIGAGYVLTVGLGGLGFVLLQHLTKAGWSVTSRRIAELTMQAIPFAGILLLPVVISTALGSGGVYPWADRHVAAEDHLVHMKHGYLNSGFFILRLAVYFGIWFWLTRYFAGRSSQQDESGDVELTKQMQWMAAPGIILFALTVSFAAFDLFMSVDPHWFSTIYGVYIFAGCMLSALSVMVIVLNRLVKQGMLHNIVTVEHFHDLGKLMFAFVFFWGYIGFSQFMLYWYGNIPEETLWFQLRTDETWGPVALILLFGHFLIPFAGLLSRGPKRDPNRLVGWAWYLLVMHAIDLFWLIRPCLGWVTHHGPDANHDAAHHGMHFSLIDILAVVGPVALAIWWVLRSAQGQRLLCVKDPRMEESLHAHNI